MRKLFYGLFLGGIIGVFLGVFLPDLALASCDGVEPPGPDQLIAPVILYNGDDCTGAKKGFPAGDYCYAKGDPNGLDGLGFKTESIRVQPGYLVTLFDNYNCNSGKENGAAVTLISSLSDLGVFGFGGKTSSLKVALLPPVILFDYPGNFNFGNPWNYDDGNYANNTQAWKALSLTDCQNLDADFPIFIKEISFVGRGTSAVMVQPDYQLTLYKNKGCLLGDAQRTFTANNYNIENLKFENSDEGMKDNTRSAKVEFIKTPTCTEKGAGACEKEYAGCECGDKKNLTTETYPWCCAESSFITNNEEYCYNACGGGTPGGCDPGEVKPHKECDGTSCKSVDSCGKNTCANNSDCGGGGNGGGGGGMFEFENPLKYNNFEDIINALINFIFWIGVVGLAPLMLIIAGFIFVTAGGSPDRVSTAKRIIIYTLIGVAILLFAKGLILVVKSILGVTS
jgi:hypothetical protein